MFRKFQRFIPNFYGVHDREKGQIKIENLLYDKDPKRVSIVDFKMGTSALTSTIVDKGW